LFGCPGSSSLLGSLVDVLLVPSVVELLSVTLKPALLCGFGFALSSVAVKHVFSLDD
jgi:hypothetical protein